MAKLILAKGGREVSFDLLDEIVFLGSAENCGVRIPGEDVAPQHAQVLKVDGRYRLVDLSGRGVVVNGQRVTQHVLENGDRITLGSSSIRFAGAVAPLPMPGVAAPQAAPRPVAAPLPPRAAGASRTSRKAELTIDPGVTARARDRHDLVRRRARSNGLPTPALLGIILACVLGGGFVAYKILAPKATGLARSELDAIDKLIQQDRYDEARARLLAIPKDASGYRVVEERLANIENLQTVGTTSRSHAHGDTEIESNILPFVGRVESDNPRYKGNVSQIRYLVKRLEDWLRNYPDHPRKKEVEALYGKYKPQAGDGPLTLNDIMIQADGEAGLRRYGAAYQSIADFLAKNSDVDPRNRAIAEQKQKDIVTKAEAWWRLCEDAAFKMIDAKNFNEAFDEFSDCAKQFEGIPELQAKAAKRAEDLQRELNRAIGAGSKG
jgi:hypothetical protein